MMSLGFFPKDIGVDKLMKGGEGMLVADIIYGYIYVKYNMLKDKETFQIPVAWILNNLLEVAGLIRGMKYHTSINRAIVFDEYFTLDTAKS